MVSKLFHMGTKLIFSFLKVSVSILFYLLIAFTVVILLASLWHMASGDTEKLTNFTYSYDAKIFRHGDKELPFTYSADSTVRYHQTPDRYMLQLEPNSSIGYYALISKLIFLCLGIAILWNFKKIFQGTNLNRPFQDSIVRRLKLLAALFIISDILKLMNYFLFNSFLHQSITTPKFQLLTDVGSDLITGLIIWIIAVVYERGAALQEENALTV